MLTCGFAFPCIRSSVLTFKLSVPNVVMYLLIFYFEILVDFVASFKDLFERVWTSSIRVC